MNTKLLASAVFAGLLATSPALQAQSLVGGATGSLRGAAAIGPGGIAGQGPVGRLGARETVGGVHRELRGTLAERRAELQEVRRQQRAERLAAEAAAEVESAASAQAGPPQDDEQHDDDLHEGRLLDDVGPLLVAGNGRAQGAGSLAGAATRPADDAEADGESPAADQPGAPQAHASGEADADADASASRQGASVGASAAARGEAGVER